MPQMCMLLWISSELWVFICAYILYYLVGFMPVIMQSLCNILRKQ
jgi:hypothetical protein